MSKEDDFFAGFKPMKLRTAAPPPAETPEESERQRGRRDDYMDQSREMRGHPSSPRGGDGVGP